MRLKTWIAFCIVCACAGTASAQPNGSLYRGFATGLVGGTMGGNVANPIITLGGTVAVQEASGWGTEIDFGVAHDQSSSFQRSDITSLIIGANYLAPTGPIHPYGTFGIGLLNLHGCLLACNKLMTTWDLGMSLGGGAQYDLNDSVGVRGDVRYMFAPGSHANSNRPENWGFWRVAFGVTFGWTVQ